jgi:hypothetical protein
MAEEAEEKQVTGAQEGEEERPARKKGKVR